MFPPLLLMLMAAMQSGEPDVATTVRRALHTPDEIAPAVLPYLACLYASRGLTLLNGTDDRPMIADNIGIGDDCAAVRQRAHDDALKLLASRPESVGTDRPSVVDQALTDIDAYVESLPSSRSGEAPSGIPQVSGLPVTMEDEVQLAYEKYQSCLTAKVRGIPLTAANALSAFDLALAACSTTRAESLEEAEVSLIAKGWGEGERKKAAQQTFAQADKSWQTMGRRLHEALLRQAGEGAPVAPDRSGETPVEPKPEN